MAFLPIGLIPHPLVRPFVRLIPRTGIGARPRPAAFWQLYGDSTSHVLFAIMKDHEHYECRRYCSVTFSLGVPVRCVYRPVSGRRGHRHCIRCMTPYTWGL